MITRCKTGNRLIREWSTKVNKASMETWEKVFAVDYLKYEKHVKRCKKCGGQS